MSTTTLRAARGYRNCMDTGDLGTLRSPEQPDNSGHPTGHALSSPLPHAQGEEDGQASSPSPGRTPVSYFCLGLGWKMGSLTHMQKWSLLLVTGAMDSMMMWYLHPWLAPAPRAGPLCSAARPS